MAGREEVNGFLDCSLSLPRKTLFAVVWLALGASNGEYFRDPWAKVLKIS